MLPELETLATQLQDNRRALDEYMALLSDAEMDLIPREGEYSGRAVLAHLAGAERGMTGLMRSMAAGQQPRLKANYDNDYYNARQQQKRAGMSVALVRAELDETRRDLLAFMETLRAEDLEKRGEHPILHDARMREVLQQLYDHEREHIEGIGVWARTLVAQHKASA